jgi:RNA polymerase sigma-70 factor, ECF subfamily
VDVSVRRVEEQLLRQLHDDHAPALLRYATRLTDGDLQRAEDVVQETLLRAWRHPEALQPGSGSIRGWLLTVARHVAVDQHRARRARPWEVDVRQADDVALATADDEIERALESWTIAEALGTLSPAHRAVIVETYYRGRSVAEAAAALGIPEGTVKSRAYYALKSLRLALTEKGMTP